MSERTEALDLLATGVDCPKCKAYADTSCKTPAGNPTRPHEARVDRAVNLYLAQK